MIKIRKEGFLSMITKTTNLDKAYESLFDEIREKSKGRINIDNMEDFFGRIEDIKDLDLKFLRLPLDEPMFEINANTRAISIPNDFRSNGLSVQGDHLAETVFFSIDRYFDFTDLSGADIAINWKMGKINAFLSLSQKKSWMNGKKFNGTKIIIQFKKLFK